MNHVSELKKRERQLRARVQSTPAAEFGVTHEDRQWVVNHLAGMETLLALHLAGFAEVDRQYEQYRLEFLLPLYTYLSRAYEIYYRAEAPVTE